MRKKKNILALENLSNVFSHIEERSMNKLINDLKPGGYFYLFSESVHKAIENDIQFPIDEIAAFRNYFYDSPFYDVQKIQKLLSSFESISDINFEISESLVFEVIEKSLQTDAPEEYLIDFMLEKIYLLFWCVTTIDTNAKNIQHKINRCLKNNMQNQDKMLKMPSDTFDADFFDEYTNLEKDTTETKLNESTNLFGLKIKKGKIKNDYRELLNEFLNSFESESQFIYNRPTFQDQQLLIDVLMFEKSNQKIKFYVDAGVFIKFLDLISDFYENHSIQHILDKNQFTGDKKANIVTSKTFTKNRSRSRRNKKFTKCFIEFEIKFLVFKSKIYDS